MMYEIQYCKIYGKIKDVGVVVVVADNEELAIKKFKNSKYAGNEIIRIINIL